MKIIGMMSGTSMDGIDICFAETDGIKNFEILDYVLIKYKKQTRNLLKIFNKNTPSLIKNNKFLKELEEKITYDHYNAAVKILNRNKYKPSVVGFHGQTIVHEPNHSKSIQLGDANLLKNLLKIDIVYNFRERDLKFNGQGAPISPIYHKFLILKNKVSLPSCFINIGGISNITYIDNQKLIGFDIGPGNCLIDKLVQEKVGISFDKNGKLANKGKIINDKLKILLGDDYFNKQYPKSLDKNYFNKYLSLFYGNKIEDTLATVSAFTSYSIARELLKFKKTPYTCILSGGGVKNNFIINTLKKICNINIVSASNIGINPDTIEAEMICYLTARRIKNLPITFPKTTGVKKAITGGELLKFKNLNQTT